MPRVEVDPNSLDLDEAGEAALEVPIRPGDHRKRTPSHGCPRAIGRSGDLRPAEVERPA
jgi:hypothetical protein